MKKISLFTFVLVLLVLVQSSFAAFCVMREHKTVHLSWVDDNAVCPTGYDRAPIWSPEDDCVAGETECHSVVELVLAAFMNSNDFQGSTEGTGAATVLELESNINFGGKTFDSDINRYVCAQKFYPLSLHHHGVFLERLEGNNHTISGLCFIYADEVENDLRIPFKFGNNGYGGWDWQNETYISDRSVFGFVDSLNNTQVSNITFDGAYIYGLNQEIGVVAGHSDGASFSNVTVKNSIVHGMVAGSIVGGDYFSAYSNVTASGNTIYVTDYYSHLFDNDGYYPETDEINLGGVAGYVSAYDVDNYQFSGVVVENNTISNEAFGMIYYGDDDSYEEQISSYLGGVVGRFISGLNGGIRNLVVRGGSLTNGKYMGAVAGEVYANCDPRKKPVAVENVSVQGYGNTGFSINLSNVAGSTNSCGVEGSFVGGLFGSVSGSCISNFSMQHSSFQGNISVDNCGANDDFNIGGLFGSVKADSFTIAHNYSYGDISVAGSGNNYVLGYLASMVSSSTRNNQQKIVANYHYSPTELSVDALNGVPTSMVGLFRNVNLNTTGSYLYNYFNVSENTTTHVGEFSKGMGGVNVGAGSPVAINDYVSGAFMKTKDFAAYMNYASDSLGLDSRWVYTSGVNEDLPSIAASGTRGNLLLKVDFSYVPEVYNEQGSGLFRDTYCFDKNDRKSVAVVVTDADGVVPNDFLDDILDLKTEVGVTDFQLDDITHGTEPRVGGRIARNLFGTETSGQIVLDEHKKFTAYAVRSYGVTYEYKYAGAGSRIDYSIDFMGGFSPVENLTNSDADIIFPWRVKDSYDSFDSNDSLYNVVYAYSAGAGDSLRKLGLYNRCFENTQGDRECEFNASNKPGYVSMIGEQSSVAEDEFDRWIAQKEFDGNVVLMYLKADDANRLALENTFFVNEGAVGGRIIISSLADRVNGDNVDEIRFFNASVDAIGDALQQYWASNGSKPPISSVLAASRYALSLPAGYGIEKYSASYYVEIEGTQLVFPKTTLTAEQCSSVDALTQALEEFLEGTSSAVLEIPLASDANPSAVLNMENVHEAMLKLGIWNLPYSTSVTQYLSVNPTLRPLVYRLAISANDDAARNVLDTYEPNRRRSVEAIVLLGNDRNYSEIKTGESFPRAYFLYEMGFNGYLYGYDYVSNDRAMTVNGTNISSLSSDVVENAGIAENGVLAADVAWNTNGLTTNPRAVRLDLKPACVDDDNPCQYITDHDRADSSLYHGVVKLVQYDNETGDTLTENQIVSREFYLLSGRSASSSAYFMPLPDENDTLTFAVYTQPEPGYDMSLTRFSPNALTSADLECLNQGDGWGLILPTEENGNVDTLLRLNPRCMGNDIYMVARYIAKNYRFRFEKILDANSLDDSGNAFIRWDGASGDYIPWEKEKTMSLGDPLENRMFPEVFAKQGCVSWILDGNIGYRQGANDGRPMYDGFALDALIDLGDDSPLRMYDGSENGFVNVLYPYFDREAEYCSVPNDFTIVQLHSDGHGTAKLVQYLGAKDVTSSQFVERIEHSFDVVQNGTSGQDTIIELPKGFGLDGGAETALQPAPVPMSFVVEVVPDEGYRLEKVWYEVNVLNNKRSVVMFEGDTIIVDGDRELFVKFRPDGPYYVKYDLGLGESDSGKVYIPMNAVEKDTLDRARFDASANDTVELWQPYRTDKCFVGWTMLNPDGEEEVVTKVAFDQLASLSINPEFPSVLSAVWQNPGVGCMLPSGNNVVTIRPAVQDENVDLVVSQFFGENPVKFSHVVPSTGEKLAVNAEYKIFVQVSPKLGYEASLGDISRNGEQMNASAEDDSYTIGGIADAGKTVSVAWTKQQVPYNIVLDNNTQEKVIYGTADWFTHRSITYGVDDDLESLIRRDACFMGWSASPNGDAASAITGKLSDNPEFLENLLQIAEENNSNELQLYAVWETASTSCPEWGGTIKVRMQYPSSLGVAEVYQNVDGNVVAVDTIFGSDSVKRTLFKNMNANIRFIPGAFFDDYFEFSQNVEGADSLCLKQNSNIKFCSGNGSVFNLSYARASNDANDFDLFMPNLESKKKDYQFVFNPVEDVFSAELFNNGRNVLSPVFYYPPWTSAGKTGGYGIYSNTTGENRNYEMLKIPQGMQRAGYCAEEEGDSTGGYLWSFEKRTQGVVVGEDHIEPGLPIDGYLGAYKKFSVAMLVDLAERNLLGLQTDTLYAVWDNGNVDGDGVGQSGCHDVGSSYGEVALSESLRGKAKVSFVQEVEGVDSVVAVLEGDDIIGIPFEGSNNYVMNFSKLLITLEPGYALDENSQTSLYYTYSDANRTPIDDDLPVRFLDVPAYNSFSTWVLTRQWPVADEAATEIDYMLSGSRDTQGGSLGIVYLTADIVENTYTFNFDVNVTENTKVFYEDAWLDSKTYRMGDASADRVFPTVNRSDACFAGWSWNQSATYTDAFASIDGEFITAFDAAADKNYTEGGTPILYAVWKNDGEDGCTVEFTTITSSVPNQGVFNLSRNGVPYEVVGDGLMVPANAGYTFTLDGFTPNPGYAYVPNSLNLPEGSSIEVVNENISLTASVLPIPVDFVFDVNYTGSVFYGASWKSDSTYDVTMSEDARTFQTAIYRTDACLAGWSWNKSATALDAMSVFDGAFLTGFYAAADEASVDSLDGVPVLYAIWKTDDCNLTNYVVTSVNADVGTLVLSLNTADEQKFDYAVNADGIVSVPSSEDLSFALSFVSNSGHSVSQSGSYYTVDDDNNKIAKIANDIVNVTSNVRILAPVTLDGLEFVFDANGGESKVFFGNDWVGSREFNIAAEEAERQFPAGLYRTDAEFEGWALTPGATRAFDAYDESFLNAVQTAKDGGFDISTLYAVWNTSAGGANVAVVSNDSAKYGSLILTRTVGAESWSDTVDNTALSVPTVEAMSFSVSFRLKPGFKYTGDGSVHFTNAAGEPVALVNNTITISENLFAAVEADYDTYTFALDENANGGNVFVAGDYSNTASFTLTNGNVDLPSGIYRANACLEGWALTADGVPYTVFDTTFVNAYNAKALADGAVPSTLYAIWDESCSQTPAPVVVHADERTVDTLVQANGHSFEIPAEGLLVPAQNLSFDVHFATKLGYEIDNTLTLKALAGNGGDEIASAVSGNVLTVGQTLWISAPVKAMESRIVYNSNAGSDKVFYGNSWTADTIFYNMDMASDARDMFSAIYRVGYRFNGWKLSTLAGQKTYSRFDEEFVADLGTATGATLYADWVADANAPVDTIVNYSASAGELVLMSLKGDAVLDTFAVADTLIIPAGLGDIEFNLAFNENAGYRIDETANYYGVDAAGRNKMILSASQQTFNANTSVKAPVYALAYTFAFKEGSASDTVFYSEGWFTSKGFDMTMSEESRAFPTGIYKVGKTLAGWALVDGGTAYTMFDDDFVTVLQNLEVVPDTLVAVWADDATIPFVVTNRDLSAGTLELKQTVGRTSVTFEVGEAGLRVPNVAGGLSFVASFDAKPGYTVGDPLFTIVDVTASDSVTAANNSSVVIASNTAFDVNVTAARSYEFAFNVNTLDTNVFYGDNWVSVSTLSLGDETPFPSVYVAGRCLAGWSLNSYASAGSMTFDDAIYSTMSADLRSGSMTLALYAVWRDCSSEQALATVLNGNSDAGSFRLTRTVDGFTKNYTVGAAGLQVPTEENMRFESVEFVSNPGYSFDDETGISSDVENAYGDGMLLVSESMTLSAAVDTVSYTFALDENAGTSNVFVADDFVNTVSVKMSDEDKSFPMGMYRADACLVGWALSAEGTPFTGLDASFISAFDAAVAQNNGVAPSQLFAVWNTQCAQTVFTVSSNNVGAGTYYLSQTGRQPIEVPAVGLMVPSVGDGLKFTVSFAENRGFNYDRNSSIALVDAEGMTFGSTRSALTVDQSMSLTVEAAPTTAQFAFDVNADESMVFYGSTWTTRQSFDISTDEDSRRFPSNVYRSDACRMGWAFTNDATTGYTVFDADFVEAMNAISPKPTTLYAVWSTECDTVPTSYVVTSVSQDAGTLKLVQTVEGTAHEYTVPVEGLNVPAGQGDLAFDLVFEPSVGYAFASSGNYYSVDNSGTPLRMLSATQQRFTVATAIQVPVDATPFTFAFNVNAAEGEVFYSTGWYESKGFDMTMSEESRAFPTGIYRVGYAFEGWALVEGCATYAEFDTNFVKEASAMAAVPSALVAVWSADTTTPFLVTNRDLSAGTLELKQTVGRTSVTFEVGEAGLLIPRVDGGLSFVADFSAKPGYTVGSPAMTAVKTVEEGDVDVSSTGSVVLADSTEFRINLTAKKTEFAFNVNTADTNVFYGDNWTSTDTLTLGDGESFPSVYLANRCFNGWSLNTNATTGSMEFDDALYASMNSSQKTGNGSVTLYAVWNDCPASRTVATVQNGNAAAGVFKLTRTVGGLTKNYTVDAAGLKVPTEEQMTFESVAFLRNPGYSYDVEAGITSSVENAYGDGMLLVSGSMTLSVEASAISYEFTLVENAGTSNVFVADDFVNMITVKMSDEDKSFPMGIYRADACVEGWALSADGIPFTELDASFISAYDMVAQNNGVAPNQLYAIWNDRCRQTLFTVYSENAGEGTFTLSQTNGHSYDVPAEGLKVPNVDDGLNFAVSFSTERGYKQNVNAGIAIMDMQGSVYGSADAGLAVDQNMMLFATVIPTTSVFAFDVNAENVDVFYGTSWKFRQTFDISDDENARKFPSAIYRNDVCFAGWNFTKNATTGYTVFDADFIDAMNALASVPTTLYAVWSTECSTAPASYVVTSASLNAGDMSLELTADGKKFSYPITAEGLRVPAGMLDVSFGMSFVQNFGYTFDATGAYSEVNENDEVLTRLTSGKLQVLSNKRLMAPVKADIYKFAFDVDADEVFYGSGWSKNGSYDLAMNESKRALPANIYRVGYKLAGWKLYEDGVEYQVFDDSLVADIHNKLFASNADVVTLQAVWVADTTTPYVVTNATMFAGALVLSQIADGDIVTFPVNESGLRIPAVQDGLEFTATFVPKNGYVLSSTPVSAKVVGGSSVNVTSNGRVVVDNSLEFTANYNVGDFEFVYNSNAKGADVFLGNSWKKSGKFSLLNEDNAFPTNIYRADACIDGWSLDPTATTGMKNFDDDFYATVESALAQNKSVDTLYAVWTESCRNLGYAIVLNENVEEGELTLSRTVDNVTLTYTVGESGLKVPTAETLSFSVSFVPKTGYIFSKQDPLFARDAAGAEVKLANNQVSVDAPVSLGAAIAVDGFTFALNTNAGDARLFYGNGWASQGYFSVDQNTVFPTNLYRTDACLKGWALAANGGQSFTKYDSSFVETLRQFQSLGLPTGTLFAVWDTYCADNYTLSSKSDRNGGFEIFQVVEGSAMPAIKVNGQGVDIPVSANGLAFVVKFAENPGYTLKDGESLFLDVGNSVNSAVENGGTIVVASNSALRASVTADKFKFKYDVNGGEANVFFGDGWKYTETKTLDDESIVFPSNIYRADAKLAGWSLNEKADMAKAYVEFTPALAAEILDNTVENTLYAVWDTTAEIEVYTVTFAEADIGSLTLSQVADDVVMKYNVPVEGLPVPLVEGGLKFKASYVLAGGYSAVDADSLYVVDENGFVGPSLVDGNLVVNKDVELTVPTEAEIYNIVFNKNSSVEPVFVGSDWLDSSKFVLGDENTVLDLPMLLYSTTTCVVGWALKPAVENDDVVFTKFNSELANAFKAEGEQNARGSYMMYAVWGEGEQCVDYNKIQLASDFGTIVLEEVSGAVDAEPIEHPFAEDGTILLPKIANGLLFSVRSIPDSSYALDSLVVTRVGDDEFRHVAIEGGSLPRTLFNTEFKAYFGKANRTPLEFVKTDFVQSGNAIRFDFATSAFEVTRGASLSAVVIDSNGVVVIDTVFADSIPSAYSSQWDLFPVGVGSYIVEFTIFDNLESFTFDTSFAVVPEVAAVSADGWQMISLAALDTNAVKWKDDDARFFWWDESSVAAEFWQYRELQRGEAIVNERGFWYSSIEGRPVPLRSDYVDDGADVLWKLDSLNSGWNLVANPHGWTLDLFGDKPSESLDVTEESPISFWKYNAGTADYEEVKVIGPYEAVWVKVSGPTDWKVPSKPIFAMAADTVAVDTVDGEPNMEGAPEHPTLEKSRALAKSGDINNWSLQAVLKDGAGRTDAWNMLGVSSTPFAVDEPPASMGNHVSLSIVDGKRALAKSVKASASENEWKIALSATSDRRGFLSFKGVKDIRQYGYKVFVTIDGKTAEVGDNEELNVSLSTRAKYATVRVAPNANTVVMGEVRNLRAAKLGSQLNVSFSVDKGLAGAKTRVDLMDMKGHVIATVNAKAVAGTNKLAFEAPKTGLYMLRVRAGSQMTAGKIMVK